MTFQQIFLFSFIALLSSCSSCRNNGNGDSGKTDSTLATVSSDNQVIALTSKIKNDPGNPENYFLRSNVRFQLGDLRGAFIDMSKAIELDSMEVKYYEAIAEIFLNGGSAENAIEAYHHALRRDPNNEDVLLKLSKVYYYNEDYLNSLKTLSRLEQINDRNPEVWFIKGMIFKESGDTTKALMAFQQAVSKNPQFYDAYIQLGLLSSGQNNLQAVAYFNNAISIDSNNVEAYYDKGKFYQDQHEFEKAKKTYRQLLAKDAQYENAYFNTGFILLLQDSVEKAFRLFDIAIKAAPQYGEAYYYRGLCSELMKNPTAAIQDYKQALNIIPDFDKARLALENLTNRN